MVAATSSGLGSLMSYRPSPIEWLRRRGSRLTPVGTDRFRLPCPVHEGNPGSMGLNLVDGTWLANCFACGFSGDAISLVMAVASIPFKAALRELDCKPGDRSAPVVMHKRPCIVVACDAPGCGRTLECYGREYRHHTTTAEEEAVFYPTANAWEVGAEGIGHLCAECAT